MTRQRLFVVLVPLLLAGIQACSSIGDDPFLREIAAIPRQKNPTVIPPELVERYVPIGTSIEAALAFFQKRGFEAYEVTFSKVPPNEKWFGVTREERYRVLLTEETRFTIESDGIRVLKFTGRIFLRH